VNDESNMAMVEAKDAMGWWMDMASTEVCDATLAMVWRAVVPRLGASLVGATTRCPYP